MNASHAVNHLNAPFGAQHFPYVPSFGILSTYSPTFSTALGEALTGRGADVKIGDAVGELSHVDVVIVQLDSDVVTLAHDMAELEAPAIVILHALPEDLTKQQHSILDDLISLADHIVVLSDDA